MQKLWAAPFIDGTVLTQLGILKRHIRNKSLKALGLAGAAAGAVYLGHRFLPRKNPEVNTSTYYNLYNTLDQRQTIDKGSLDPNAHYPDDPQTSTY